MRRGAAWGAVVFLALVAGLAGAGSLGVGLGRVLNVPVGALLGLGFASFMGASVALGAKALEVLPRFLSWMGLAAVGALVVLVEGPLLPFTSDLAAAGVGLGLGLLAAAAGAAVASSLGGELRRATLAKRIAVVSTLVLAGVVSVLLAIWLVYPGSEAHLVTRAALELEVPPLGSPDPSQPGEHAVLSLTYGSGTDLHRPEFGEEVDLETEPVDASDFIDTSDWRVKLRDWYWGFDVEHFPRNGRVWYPEGAGPFPLVLVVHGNHSMLDYSDVGYDYLGELLASRGFITVSVDENFMNGWWVRGLSRENDARGWLLLQHLALWREWSQTGGHPFFGKVDLDAIGLIGHSRGGEAAAIAGAFNRLSHYPDDADVEFDFGFGIRAIVAIAPSDGQYKPTGRPTPLANVSYLVLQGGHDADVAAFAGARQYERVEFNDGADWFKASLYVYRANHGQFNTVWGDTDRGWPHSRMLNRAPLLTGEEQRQIGKVYMSAFLEATLHGRSEYVPLFRDHRTVSAWLPEDVYITRFEDAHFDSLSDYEDDIDLKTTSQAGGAIQAEGLAVWREQNLAFRNDSWGHFENNVAVLGWHDVEQAEPNAPEPSYSIFLPERGLEPLAADSLLVFSLAELDENPPPPEEDEEEADEADDDEDDEPLPLEVTIELETSSGARVRLALAGFRGVPPVLESRFTKLWSERESYERDSECVLQTFELPLGEFARAAEDFEPSDLAVIRFIFGRSSSRVVALDRVGFARPSPGA